MTTKAVTVPLVALRIVCFWGEEDIWREKHGRPSKTL